MRIIFQSFQILFFLAILSNSANGQNLHFQSYTSTEGLSQNSIYSMAETSDGLMWFGTQAGINRFDGKKFKTIIPSMTLENGHSNNFSKMITTLYCDHQDHLWVGTTKELLLFDRYKDKFLYPKEIYIGFVVPSNVWFKKVVEDTHDNIWVITQENGAYCYNKKNKSMTLIQSSGTIYKKMINIITDDNGDIWLATKNEIYKYSEGYFTPISVERLINKKNITISDICLVNGSVWAIINSSEIIIFDIKNSKEISHRYFAKDYNGKYKLSDARIIHQSDKNTVWIGSRSDGLLKVDLKTKSYIKAGAAGSLSSLGSQFILSFYTNKQDITWIGLSGGLAKYDLQKVQFDLWRINPDPNKPVPDNKIFSILGDTQEDFYLGTLYGGLLHYNIKTNKHAYLLPPFNSYSANDAKTIYEVIKGDGNTLWMASKGGLYSFDKVSKKFTEYVDQNDEQTRELTVLLKLKNSNKLLVAGYNGGLIIFNIDTKKWEKCLDTDGFLDNHLLRVRHLKELEDGVIYLSTEEQNLVKYDTKSGLFTTYPALQKISGISRHFSFDGKDCWVATDDGLIQTNASDMKIKKIWNTKNGLPNNYIYAVVPDNYGRIWISSNLGLAMLDVKKEIIRKFTKEDGLQELEFNTASCFKNSEGKIYFGGINGFNMVNPDLRVHDTFSPSPIMTGIQVMNNPYISDIAVSYIDSIELSYDKNFINFEFQTPNYSQTENITYQYMLSGVDSSWVYSGTRNFASYTQLKPGNYTFYVKSANINGVWCSKPKTLFIKINQPWYQTKWFLSISFALIGLFAFFAIKQILKNIKMREILKIQWLEAEMKALRSQMNPHFIFNSLNSIENFILKNERVIASEYLGKFSKLIRNILDNSKSEEIPLIKEIETIKLYIELERIRTDNAFDVSYNISNSIIEDNIMVPPMLMQPHIENAILHGIRYLEDKKGLLIVSMVIINDDCLEYSIEDNGVGRTKSNEHKTYKNYEHKSFGLEITQNRIDLYNQKNKVEITFTVEDLYDTNQIATGTKVVVLIPLI